MRIFKVLLEFILNLFVPLFISKILGLSNKDTLLVIAGTFLIDFDHIIYVIFSEKRFTPQSWLEFFRVNFYGQIPHFYLCHTIEILIVFTIIGYLLYTPILYLTLGFWINWFIDIFTYLKKYRSLKPWVKYFSLFTVPRD